MRSICALLNTVPSAIVALRPSLGAMYRPVRSMARNLSFSVCCAVIFELLMAFWVLSRSNSLYASRAACVMVLILFRYPLMSPVFRATRNPSYSDFPTSIVRPHSSMFASEAKKASLATSNAPPTAAMAVPKPVSCVILMPNFSAIESRAPLSPPLPFND